MYIFGLEFYNMISVLVGNSDGVATFKRRDQLEEEAKREVHWQALAFGCGVAAHISRQIASSDVFNANTKCCDVSKQSMKPVMCGWLISRKIAILRSTRPTNSSADLFAGSFVDELHSGFVARSALHAEFDYGIRTFTQRL